MDTSLLIYLDGIWKRVDIYEDIPIAVMIQQLDINALDSRKSSYTKQFVVPNTNTNAIIFEHYFEVNGIEFNPLTKIQCVVQYRGTDIFTGLLRLSAVVENPNYTDYEVYIMGQVGDFASEIRNITLQDLQWDDLQHKLSYSAITKSWEAKNNDVDGLFGGKILYPMINYGLPYVDNGSTASPIPGFTYTFGEEYSFDQSTQSVPEYIWKPSIRVKEVINRIFAKTDYNVISEFFETDYFKSMYMDTFQNGQLGVTVASAVTNQNIFKVYMRPSTVFTFGSAGARPLNFQTFRGDGYDPLNNFVLGPGVSSSIDPPNPPFNTNYFRVPFAGNYAWNFRFNYDDNNVCGGDIDFQIYARKGGDLSTLDSQPPFAVSDLYQLPTCGADASVNWFFSGVCGTGEYVRLYVDLKSSSTRGKQLRFLPYNEYSITSEAPMWDLYSTPLLFEPQNVNIRLGLQQINCIEFLKGLITLFNLVVIQDEVSQSIIIEPFNWYYNQSDRIKKDWTQRLDLNSTYRIEPLSFDLPKELNFTWTKGSEEYLNKLFEDANKFQYGRFKYTSTNNLLAGEQNYEVPFAATPTTVVNGADNFIIPAVYRELNTTIKTTGATSGYTYTTLQPYSNKPHLFFWTGNRFCYKDEFKQVQGTWYLSSGATPIEQTTYPCVSHLSSLDIQIPNLISDLNFKSTFDFFGNYNPLPVQFTQYNLWNLFWEDYVENNYSNETRRLSGRFLLRPTDIYETSLTDRIFVKDSFYRIEKINEGSLIETKLTEISLIKELGGYYKVIPPAPYYTLSGNTPYPGILSAYTLNCYTGFTITPVCNGTAPTVNLTTFGVSGLSNNQPVYYDTGTEYIPVGVGTYVRYTADTTTYVVINSVGQILQQNC
jgi:hypothetical protein